MTEDPILSLAKLFPPGQRRTGRRSPINAWMEERKDVIREELASGLTIKQIAQALAERGYTNSKGQLATIPIVSNAWNLVGGRIGRKRRKKSDPKRPLDPAALRWTPAPQQQPSTPQPVSDDPDEEDFAAKFKRMSLRDVTEK